MRTPYSLSMCCIFTYRTKNEQRLSFLTRSSRTYTRLPYIVLNLQLECDMGWYWYRRLVMKTTAQSVSNTICAGDIGVKGDNSRD